MDVGEGLGPLDHGGESFPLGDIENCTQSLNGADRAQWGWAQGQVQHKLLVPKAEQRCGRSLAADRPGKANTAAKPGHGDKGDRRLAKKKR